jgi:hypothetical protein
MSGATPVLPPNASLLCTGTTFYVHILRTINLKTGEKHAFVTPINSESARCNII